MNEADRSQYTVSAEFLRSVILGVRKLHSNVTYVGPYIRGAIISSSIDLTGSTNVNIFSLDSCLVLGDITLDFAHTGPIFLDRSLITGCLSANRAVIDGSLYLRFNLEVLRGANLSGINVKGSLSCRGAKFGSEKTTSHENFTALRLVDANVRGALIFGPRTERDVQTDDSTNNNTTIFFGRVSLRGTKCAVFVDHEDAYKHLNGGEKLYVNLNGFVYDRLDGIDTGNVARRLLWLGLQPPANKGANFRPQPYEHLVGVLRSMGLEVAATKIAIKREDLRRDANYAFTNERYKRSRKLKKPYYAVLNGLLHLYYVFLKYSVGYGYSPIRAILFIVPFILFGTVIFSETYQRGSMVPTNGILALKPQWLGCKEHAFGSDLRFLISDKNLLAAFTWDDTDLDKCLKKTFNRAEGKINNTAVNLAGIPDYVEFSAFWFSVDSFVPLLNLRQEDFWVPQGSWYWGRLYLYFHVAFGWLFVSFAVAGVLGLVNKRAGPKSD